MASIIRKTLGSYSILLRRSEVKDRAALIGRGDDFNAKSVGRRLRRNAGVVVNDCLAPAEQNENLAVATSDQ